VQTLRRTLFTLSFIMVLPGVSAGAPLDAEEQRALIEDIAFAYSEVLAAKKSTDKPLTEEYRRTHLLEAMRQAVYNDYQRKYQRLTVLCKRYLRRYNETPDPTACPPK
jgi:hypothetical protein